MISNNFKLKLNIPIWKIKIEENLHNKQTWDECEMKKKRRKDIENKETKNDNVK